MIPDNPVWLIAAFLLMIVVLGYLLPGGDE